MFLFGLLILTLSAAWCQGISPGCKLSHSRKSVACKDIAEFTTVAARLALREDQYIVHSIIIAQSPRLKFKEQDIAGPAFVNVTNLSFTNSNLTTFDPKPFQSLKKFSALTLTDNNLTSITSDMFTGLADIDELNMEGNQIRNIDPSAFANFKLPFTLDLSKNGMTSIPVQFFEGARLRSVNFGNNELTSIDDQSFGRSDNLAELSLVNNKLTTIDYRAFVNLPKLFICDLTDNQLESLDGRLFAGNPRMFSLTLSENNLKNLENFPINSSSLWQLALSHCNIRTIPADYFINVPNLRLLHLDGNRISVIAPDQFSALPKLLGLHLAKNQMTSLSVASFQQFHVLKGRPAEHILLKISDGYPKDVNTTLFPTFVFSSNPWNCSTSDMLELRSWSTEHQVAFDKVFKCA